MIKEYILYGLNEPLNNFSTAIYSSYHPVSLDIISLLCIVSCILCVSINNPVISVLFLIALFANVGLYLIILGISFIGLVYIVVYIGAVTILFLFVIMLINIQLSQIKTYNINNGIPVGMGIGISFWLILYLLIKDQMTSWNNYIGPTGQLQQWVEPKVPINLDKALSSIWDINIFDISQISSIGYVMYSSHFIWFIYVSLILLLAMIGAIQLTIRD